MLSGSRRFGTVGQMVRAEWRKRRSSRSNRCLQPTYERDDRDCLAFDEYRGGSFLDGGTDADAVRAYHKRGDDLRRGASLADDPDGVEAATSADPRSASSQHLDSSLGSCLGCSLGTLAA